MSEQQKDDLLYTVKQLYRRECPGENPHWGHAIEWAKAQGLIGLYEAMALRIYEISNVGKAGCS